MIDLNCKFTKEIIIKNSHPIFNIEMYLVTGARVCHPVYKIMMAFCVFDFVNKCSHVIM